LQQGTDGKWCPVAFYSKSLNDVQQNYMIHEKEMLVIVRALEEWQHFLEGMQHPVEIWMDHKNLEYFQKSQKLNWWQARWSLYLSQFDFTCSTSRATSRVVQMHSPTALTTEPVPRTQMSRSFGQSSSASTRWRELWSMDLRFPSCTTSRRCS
jgi:hypothetical protein